MSMWLFRVCSFTCVAYKLIYCCCIQVSQKQQQNSLIIIFCRWEVGGCLAGLFWPLISLSSVSNALCGYSPGIQILSCVSAFGHTSSPQRSSQGEVELVFREQKTKERKQTELCCSLMNKSLQSPLTDASVFIYWKEATKSSLFLKGIRPHILKDCQRIHILL